MNLNQTRLQAFVWMVLAAVASGCQTEKSRRAEFFLPREPDVRATRAAEERIKTQQSIEQDEIEVVEVVLSRFVKDVSTTLNTQPKLIFLSFTGNFQDPSPTLQRQLNVRGVRLQPLSTATVEAVSTSAEAKQTFLLNIELLEWIDSDRAQVTCSWSSGGTARRYFAYDVERSRRRWTVR